MKVENVKIHRKVACLTSDLEAFRLVEAVSRLTRVEIEGEQRGSMNVWLPLRGCWGCFKTSLQLREAAKQSLATSYATRFDKKKAECVVQTEARLRDEMWEAKLELCDRLQFLQGVEWGPQAEVSSPSLGRVLASWL